MTELLKKYLLSSAALFSSNDPAGSSDDNPGDGEGGEDDTGDSGGGDQTAGGDQSTAGDDEGGAEGADAKATAEATANAEKAKKVPWFKLRMNALGHTIRAKEKEVSDTKAMLAARDAELAQIRAQLAAEDGEKPAPTGDTRTPAQIDAEINRRAEAMADQRATLREITRESDRVYDEGVKKFGKESMEEAVATFNSDAGGVGLRDDLVKSLIKVPNGADVFHFLGHNGEEIERLYRLDPIDLAIEVTKMSAKLATPPAQRRAASNAPAPIKPTSGRGGNVDATAPDDKDDMSTWVAKRNADLQKRGVRL